MGSQYINSVIEGELEEIEDVKKRRKEEGSSSDLSNSFVSVTYFVLKCAVSVEPSAVTVKVVS